MSRIRFRVVIVALLAVFSGTFAGGSSAEEQNPDPRAGMKVFWDKGCVRCHPVLGRGGNVGPDLSRAPSTGDNFQLAAAMWNHAPQMWQNIQQQHIVFPTFDLHEMENLFSFLAMVRSFDEPGDAKAGRQIFQSKRCVECHAIRGQGARVGPDLATVGDFRNPVAWVAAMWNHATGMFQQLSRKNIAFPQFQGTEMVDLETYIRSMSGKERLRPDYLLPPSTARGQALFQSKKCATCHSIDGRGGKIGPDLGRVVLPRRYGEIAVVMWNHAPQMIRLAAASSVAYPNFEPQELSDVLAYLNSFSATPAGNPAEGAKIFAAKGCSSCHSTIMGKSSAGPNLSNLQQGLTPAGIARVMWNHGPTMLKRMETSSIPWPEFNNRELSDTLAFLKSIQRPAPQAATTGGPR